jgi:hypothetical protein
LRKTRRKSEEGIPKEIENKSNLLKLYRSLWGPQFQSRQIPYPSLYGDPRAFRLPVYTGCPRIMFVRFSRIQLALKIKEEKKSDWSDR